MSLSLTKPRARVHSNPSTHAPHRAEQLLLLVWYKWSVLQCSSSSSCVALLLPAAACCDATVLMQLMQPRSWRLPRLCEANRERECAELADTGRLRLNVRPFVARRMHNSLPFETNTHHQQQLRDTKHLSASSSPLSAARAHAVVSTTDDTCIHIYTCIHMYASMVDVDDGQNRRTSRAVVLVGQW